MRQHDAAVAEFEKAVALNPNFTDWRFGWALLVAGEPARAIEVYNAHMRLDPFYPPNVPACLGLAYYMLGHYADALPLFRESSSRSPDYRGVHQFAAATYAQLGELEKARAEADEVLRIEPSYIIEGTAKRIVVFKHAKDADHFLEGLRKAGLP